MMNMRILKIVAVTLACIGMTMQDLSAAMPTENQCKVAQKKLDELMSDIYKSVKAKTKTSSEAADAVMEYADNEERAAERLILMREAFGFYVMGKNLDGLIRVYQRARSVGGAEYASMVAKPYKSKLSGFSSRKFPQIQSLREQISEDDKSVQRIRSVKAQLQSKPGDTALCEKLGNEYVAAGDWESALSSYLTVDGELAKIAEWELAETKNADFTAAKIGAYWWKKSEDSDYGKTTRDSMKKHASEWYRVALDDDSFKGSDRAIIEKRIADAAMIASVKSADSALYGMRIPCIESTGEQWIDTGIIPDSKTKIELIDFVITAWNAGWCEFCGSGSGDGSDDCFELRRVCDRDKVGVRIGNPHGGDYSNYSSEIQLKRKYPSVAFDIDGLKGRPMKPEMVDGNINKNHKGKNSIFIFASNYNGKPFRPAAMRIAGVKIWQSKKMVRDLIPVMNDGEICMFDNVSKKLFKNLGAVKFKK